MPQYTTRVDEISPTEMYLGKAAPGSAESSPVWQIRKVETIGTLLSVKFPDGIDTFNSSWTSRASLIYS